jgi:pilus assembly protein Flp/PilA
MNMSNNDRANLKQTGQGLVEYALILVLVAAIVTAVFITIGPTVGNNFSKVAILPHLVQQLLDQPPQPHNVYQ